MVRTVFDQKEYRDALNSLTTQELNRLQSLLGLTGQFALQQGKIVFSNAYKRFNYRNFN